MTKKESIQVSAEIAEQIDRFEASIVEGGTPVDCPVNHSFVGGMYIREILMPAKTWVTSMEHLTTHPFFVLQGVVSVFSENFGEELISAPYRGITIPNTRRVIYIHEACVWITVHQTDIVPKDDSPEAIEEAVKQVEDIILSKRENVLLGGRIKNNIISQSIENECLLSPRP